MSEAELIEIEHRAERQVAELRITYKVAHGALARFAAKDRADALLECLETDGKTAAGVAADTARLCDYIRKLEGRC